MKGEIVKKNSYITKFFKKNKKTKLLFIVVVVIGIVFFIFSKNGQLEFDTQIAEVGKVRQIVSETGVVEPSEDVTLSFARSGRMSGIYFKKGDLVKKGQTVAILDTGLLNAQLQQAEASLEKVLIEKDIERAEISLSATKQDVVNLLLNTYIEADDAIRNKADQAFKDSGDNSPTIIYAGNDYDDRDDINKARRDLTYLLKKWKKDLDQVSIDSDFTPHIQVANDNLLVLRNYLTDLSLLVNRFQPIEGILTSTQVSTYQASVSSARSSINTTISSLNTTVESYNSEKLFLEQTYNSEGELLALKNIKVRELQAQINAIHSQMSDAVIISPISGVVVNIFYDVGESVNATSPVVSIISVSSFDMSVDIPEDDIANVGVGDKAEVTFDAYDNLIFEAEVVFISTNAEVVDGVPVFEVTLQFKELDPLIKAGLSVDIDIVAEERDGVVTISSRAIIDEPAGQFVRIVNEIEKNTYIKTPVTLGLKGEGGMVQVLSGVNKGDKIITFIEDSVLEKFNQK